MSSPKCQRLEEIENARNFILAWRRRVETGKLGWICNSRSKSELRFEHKWVSPLNCISQHSQLHFSLHSLCRLYNFFDTQDTIETENNVLIKFLNYSLDWNVGERKSLWILWGCEQGLSRLTKSRDGPLMASALQYFPFDVDKKYALLNQEVLFPMWDIHTSRKCIFQTVHCRKYAVWYTCCHKQALD